MRLVDGHCHLEPDDTPDVGVAVSYTHLTLPTILLV